MKLKVDERLGVLVRCNRPDAGLARVTCARMGHTEMLVLCNKCLYAITYCEQCMAVDHLLVRAKVLAVA